LKNPNLFEHEKFTELLQAVFHLHEELTARDHFDALPDSDYQNLVIDINPFYVRLVQQ
jgi:voltage-gated potassium channel